MSEGACDHRRCSWVGGRQDDPPNSNFSSSGVLRRAERDWGHSLPREGVGSYYLIMVCSSGRLCSVSWASKHRGPREEKKTGGIGNSSVYTWTKRSHCLSDSGRISASGGIFSEGRTVLSQP